MIDTTVKIKTGRIHKLTRKAVDRGNHVIIHRGGTGSGKTYDIMIYLIFYVACQQDKKIITIASESRPHLEIGVIRIMKEVMQKAGIWDESKWHRTLSKYTFETGSIIEFFSADRIGKALGARRDWLFGNEINSLSLDVWDELARRSQNVIGDFNPVSQFWLEDWLENYDDTEVIISNYKFNEFLSDIERSRIIRRADRDPNFKRVHIDCEYGVYEGLVFTQWQQVDEMPEDGITVFGLDFGFTNDPTALVKVMIKGNDLFVDELIYRTGLLNRDIARMMKQLGVDNHEVYADSAEPKSIQEIFLAGFNVKPAIKGPGSVNAGIDKLKSYSIKVTKRSVNLIKELRNYAWVSDKEGNPTNKPIDAFNHCFDKDTLVLTRKGQKPIYKITEDDIIINSFGEDKIISNGITGYNKIFVYNLYFDNFVVKLKCTNNHLIYTNEGWTQISNLKQGMTVFLSRNLTDLNTSCIRGKGILAGEQKDCIGLFWNTFMEKSRKDLKPITKMGTHSIIHYQILRLLNQPNTEGITERKELRQTESGLRNSIKRELSQLKSGTKVKRVANGINYTQRNVISGGLTSGKKNVLFAQLSSEQKQAVLSSAQINARHKTEGTIDLTTRRESVNIAEQNFHVPDFQNKSIVQSNVLVNIEVENNYFDYTWDITLENKPEFFANGVLVHNCADSIRYAIFRDEPPKTTDPEKVKGIFF